MNEKLKLKKYEKAKFNIQNEIRKNDKCNGIIKFFKCTKEYTKTILLKLSKFIVFILTYWLYFLSLEACYEGEGHCSNHIYWIKKKVFEEIISCVFLSIIIQLIIFKKISKLHIIHIIVSFTLFYCYSHGMDFENHGYFNFFLYFIIVAILTSIMAPFNLIIFCMPKIKNKKLFFIYLGALCFFAILFYFYLFNYKTNCSDWSKGLNNTYIDNNTKKYGCQIQIPTKCSYKIFKYVQDYTKLSGKNCKSLNNKKLKEILLRSSKSPFIKNTSCRIGFPLTNKNPVPYTQYNQIYKFSLNNLVDMDNQELLDKFYKEKIPEIEVDFVEDNDKGKIVIDLKFNKTLSEERKLLENNSEPFSNNIMLL